jgi:SAM-dependent methyltransferase
LRGGVFSGVAVDNFWDREVLDRQHVPWMGIDEVREYLNTLIGENEPLWPIDWLLQWLGKRRFRRALSIGCGSGALERQLITLGLAGQVDAFDGSVVSLHMARKQADAEGCGDRIRYFAADFNEPSLPHAKYDIVFFNQSAHHVGKLEKLYRAILRALKPDGIIYLDEYVGPSRFDWQDELLVAQRAEFAAIDPALRLTDDIPFPIQEDDPSEAIRSSAIEPQLRIGFDVLARRPYGGTLLSVVIPQLHVERLARHDILRLIERERALLAAGAKSYYALIVARPKRGLARTWARMRYWLEPKVRAQLIELRRMLRGA